MPRKLTILAALLAAVCLATPLMAADFGDSSIVGAVVDAYGKSIPGASVHARHDSDGFSVEAICIENGTYVLTDLPAGQYTVTATAKGASVAKKKIKLGQAQRLKLVLQVDVKERNDADPDYRAPQQGFGAN